jgi:membrane fusion protein, multidrug efflux system
MKYIDTECIIFGSKAHKLLTESTCKSIRKHLKTFMGSWLLVLVLLFTGYGCGKKTSQNGERTRGRKARATVEVQVVKPELLLNTVFTTGSILANEKIELRPEVSGLVTGIYFDEGALVPEGKLLVKIDDRDLQAQLQKNEAQGKLLSDDEYREKKLLEIKAISQEEYEDAYNQLMLNKADEQLLQAQIAKTEISAPFTGEIGLRQVSPGSYVASNTLIATLQQLDPVKMEFEVPEKYSSYIKKGMEVSFTAGDMDSTFKAKVYAYESSINLDTRTLKARALCPNPKDLLRPGVFTHVSIVLERFPDALKIPSEAVVTELNGSSVFICKNGKAKYVSVKTGIRTDSDIQITQGLAPGDSLIVSGLLQITDGSPVRVGTGNAD